jgi:hypothetical protein
MFLVGRGVPRDEDAAAAWLRRGAEHGFALAQYDLGLLHLQGRGVDRDAAVAALWIGLAAEAGLAEAQEKFGRMHELGHGVPADRRAAYAWYHLAAAQGCAPAFERRDALAGAMTSGDIEAAEERARALRSRAGGRP